MLYFWLSNNETSKVSFVGNVLWTSTQFLFRWFNSVKFPSSSTRYLVTTLFLFGKNLLLTTSENKPNFLTWLSIAAVLPNDISPSV